MPMMLGKLDGALLVCVPVGLLGVQGGPRQLGGRIQLGDEQECQSGLNLQKPLGTLDYCCYRELHLHTNSVTEFELKLNSGSEQDAEGKFEFEFMEVKFK